MFDRLHIPTGDTTALYTLALHSTIISPSSSYYPWSDSDDEPTPPTNRRTPSFFPWRDPGEDAPEQSEDQVTLHTTPLIPKRKTLDHFPWDDSDDSQTRPDPTNSTYQLQNPPHLPSPSFPWDDSTDDELDQSAPEHTATAQPPLQHLETSTHPPTTDICAHTFLPPPPPLPPEELKCTKDGPPLLRPREPD